MTTQEKVERLRARGFQLRHLFGRWYLGRVWKNRPFWWVYRIR